MINEKLKQELLQTEKATTLEFETFFDQLVNTLKETYNESTFGSLNVKQILKSLDEILEFCRINSIENQKIIIKILKQWTHDDDDIDGVLGDIIANIYCKKINIAYLCETLKSLTSPLSILDVHICSRHSDAGCFGFVAERVLDFFNLENLEEFEWNHLLDIMKKSYTGSNFDPRILELQSNLVTKDGADIIEYIEIKLEELKSSKDSEPKIFAPKPEYINLLSGETEKYYENLSEDEIKETQDSEKEAKDLKELLEKYVKIPENPNIEPGEIATATVDEVIDMYLTTKNNNRKLKKEFLAERYFGPINAIKDDICCSTPKNKQCSMFYCMCRELSEEEGFDLIREELISIANSWFKGQCDFCEKKIQKMRYAVRYPMENGGFIGCYCSFNCIYGSKHYPIYDNDDLRIQEINYLLKLNKVADF
jgi:hypothetical protein